MTTAINYELIKQLAVLAQGRAPVLRPQGWVFQGQGGPPANLTAGIDVTDALVAQVGVRLRSDPAAWKAWLRIDTLDAGEFYGATFAHNGVAANYTKLEGGGADIPSTLAALKVTLDADAQFLAYGGTATLLASPNDDILEYSFSVDNPVRLDGADDAGNTQATTAFQSLAAEARICAWRLWGLPIGHDIWTSIDGGRCRVSRQAMELHAVPVAGFRRVFVEVVRADGEVLPFVGPAGVDNQVDTEIDAAQLELTLAEGELFDFPATSTGNLAHIVTAPESDPAGSADGIDVSGVDAVQVSVGSLNTITDYDLQIWTFDGHDWTKANGGTFAGRTESFSELFATNGAQRFRAVVDGLTGTSVELTYAEAA